MKDSTPNVPSVKQRLAEERLRKQLTEAQIQRPKQLKENLVDIKNYICNPRYSKMSFAFSVGQRKIPVSVSFSNTLLLDRQQDFLMVTIKGIAQVRAYFISDSSELINIGIWLKESRDIETAFDQTEDDDSIYCFVYDTGAAAGRFEVEMGRIIEPFLVSVIREVHEECLNRAAKFEAALLERARKLLKTLERELLPSWRVDYHERL